MPLQNWHPGKLGVVLGLVSVAFCQAPPQTTRLTFEVASVKPASGGDPDSLYHGGPPRVSATRFEFRDTSLAGLIAWAYGIRSDQITGPGWLQDARFDVVANMLAGSSPRQTQEMTLSLLSDRFKLAAHKTEKPVSVYALKVGPGGIRLKESNPADSTRPGCRTGGCDGYSCRRLTMRSFALNMSQPFWQKMAGLGGLPVVDLTD